MVIDEAIKILGGRDMTMIPDCRTDDNYNENRLKEDDKSYIKGYDWCTEEVDCFFDNIGSYYSDDSYIMHYLNSQVPGSDKTYLDELKENLLDWIEVQRNHVITGIIDGYGEE